MSKQIQHPTWRPSRMTVTIDGRTHEVDSHDYDDQIKKLANQISLAQAPATPVPQTQPIVPATPAPAPPYKQVWKQDGTVISDDVRTVIVHAPNLTLTRYGANTVFLQDIDTGEVVYGTYGTWTCLNETLPVPMWGNTQPVFHVEAEFIYANATKGTLLRIGANPNNTVADFIIIANYDGTVQTTAKWYLNCGSNAVTMPAPAGNTKTKIKVEFDGSNPGTGIAQWLVGVATNGGGFVQQTLTVVNNNNQSIVPQAMRMTWGGDYIVPTTFANTDVNPFDGVIGFRRGYTTITHSLITEPPYTSQVFLYDPQVGVRCADYIEGGTVTLTQAMSGNPQTATITPYMLTTNSYITATFAAIPTGLADLGCISRTPGFPGSFSITTNPQGGVVANLNCDYAVHTPNVVWLENLCSDEKRYHLYRAPLGSGALPAVVKTFFRSFGGMTTPEPFINI